MELTVGTFNIEHLGWEHGKGHHRLDDALNFLLTHTPVPPDILALPEATHCLDDGQDVLRRRVIHPLAQHLDGDGWYEPFYASRGIPDHANHHHLLLINTRRLKPLGWHDPSLIHGCSTRLAGFVQADLNGHHVRLCCEHWPGGLGRGGFERAANRVSTLGGPRNKTLLLGDFNATSSWSREHLPDWHDLCERRNEQHKVQQKGRYNPATGRWEVDTRQLDWLRHEFGYLDMGEEAGDPTVTTHPDEGSNLRIDRIFRSQGFPATVIDYHVRQPPRTISDHAYVHGTYAVTPSRE